MIRFVRDGDYGPEFVIHQKGDFSSARYNCYPMDHPVIIRYMRLCDYLHKKKPGKIKSVVLLWRPRIIN
jgi:hypothetical protein